MIPAKKSTAKSTQKSMAKPSNGYSVRMRVVKKEDTSGMRIRLNGLLQSKNPKKS
jgi:hypothetical protein